MYRVMLLHLLSPVLFNPVLMSVSVSRLLECPKDEFCVSLLAAPSFCRPEVRHCPVLLSVALPVGELPVALPALLFVFYAPLHTSRLVLQPKPVSLIWRLLDGGTIADFGL